jgi:hypothetical protein
VYAGHAAVALALRAREPRLPIVPLTLACYGPDWIEVALMFPHKRAGMAVFTHSIPAVVIGAAIAAGLWSLTRRPGARLLGLGWLLHWPADLFTGTKPVVFATPLIGLDLYKIPFVDFLLESTVIVIGCAIYARGFPARAELRRVIVILGAALIALQATVDVALSVMRNTDWEPSLASAQCRSHLPAIRRSRLDRTPHAICTSQLALSKRGSDGDGRTPGHRDAGLPHLRQGKVLHEGSAGSREL